MSDKRSFGTQCRNNKSTAVQTKRLSKEGKVDWVLTTKLIGRVAPVQYQQEYVWYVTSLHFTSRFVRRNDANNKTSGLKASDFSI